CEGKILVAAYTNRAVDEIVEILNKENLNHLFLRIGTKESSIYRQNLLPYLIEELEPEELEEKINNNKIILGTAHSFLTNPEIFDLNKFQVAIVDEASQLLFPHIAGILAYVDKFILIGDEKQLPPVILQEKFATKVKSEILRKLNFEHLSMSYFEFLLRVSRSKSWKNSYGTLNKQSRMHPKVLEPINKFFYHGIITTNPSRKSQESIAKIISFMLNKFNLDARKRVFFIDCPRENKKKINSKQADLISYILNESFLKLDGDITSETFGIISPFRAQNFEIYSKLLPQLRKIVTIDTIERFQGSERDIILLSLPFNYLSEIYLSCNVIKTENNVLIDRKLNVALTRARELLLVFGNSALLSQSKYYSDFLKTFFTDFNTYKPV
ncbi:MAG: DEAD/DEAH box helicase, partial [Candidatus Kapaibacteriota bacterium]